MIAGLGKVLLGKKLWLGVGLSLLAALAFLGWQYREQVAQVATLQANVAQYQRALNSEQQATQRLRQERNHLEQVLAEREQARQQVQEQARALRGEIDRLRREHEDVEEWAGQRVPGAVIERLRNHSTGSNRNQD